MLFENKLFRKEALEHKGQAEPLDHLLRVTAPHEWMIVCAFAILMACIVAWAALGSIEQRISTNCTISVAGERHAVFALDTGVVSDILVQPGERVEQGQTIAKIRSVELMRRERFARIQLEQLEELPQSIRESIGSDIEAARTELRLSKALLDSGESIISEKIGQIVSLPLVSGQTITEGTTIAWLRTGDEHNFEALSLVTEDLAKTIEPDSVAHIVVPSLSEGEITFDAKVSLVSPAPTSAPSWLLQDSPVSDSNGNHLIRAVLKETQVPTVMDRSPCRIWFTRAPVSLFHILFGSDVSTNG
ncbi:MAG: hypothetical protein OXE41_12500 [Gammaproteobacteria bacterium]|nr:hypothetical protein [Gammaproteobacteria bacterium]MCY4219727.1 hypothetical protein [Gammaproteobacteria bacterium]MCY4276189.1 hypothetical protein [Gammaproteobacteria bacterium]